MTSKERMLIALAKGKPDRLPVTLHQWQDCHLKTYLGGMTDLEAFRHFGLDASIAHFQAAGQFWHADSVAFSGSPGGEWRDEPTVLDRDPDHTVVQHTITTPSGTLTYATEANRKTTWVTEYLIKHDEDIELIRRYMPFRALDLAEVSRAYDEIRDDGILRGFVWGDQAGCWQHACCLMDTTEMIMACFDKPDWVHELMAILLEKKLKYIETMKGAKFDLIETGGGAGSSTVISPDLHREFCLPYDRKMHDALHSLGFKIAYHTCGGTNGIEEHIVANGCDASETLAPVSIGGNQEPWEFATKIGGRLALIGGIDQFNVATEGTPELIRAKVWECFEKVGPNGGYICSLSDHFFDASVENLQAFADSALDCVY
ncbi:MAG TPA: uroporphyrinogen decarboxylase family protein [Fimbriimonadaceae bacterium]|nr:uroporphyrinogen decarboxylase family protein [Fimbriimonadaceae bacterium]